jgi:hypothetical protein
MPRNAVGYRGTKFSENEFTYLCAALRLDDPDDRRMLIQVLQICSAGHWDVGGPYSQYRIKRFLRELSVIPFDPSIRWHPREQCPLLCTAYVDITRRTTSRHQAAYNVTRSGCLCPGDVSEFISSVIGDPKRTGTDNDLGKHSHWN